MARKYSKSAGRKVKARKAKQAIAVGARKTAKKTPKKAAKKSLTRKSVKAVAKKTAKTPKKKTPKKSVANNLPFPLSVWLAG